MDVIFWLTGAVFFPAVDLGFLLLWLASVAVALRALVDNGESDGSLEATTRVWQVARRNLWLIALNTGLGVLAGLAFNTVLALVANIVAVVALPFILGTYVYGIALIWELRGCFPATPLRRKLALWAYGSLPLTVLLWAGAILAIAMSAPRSSGGF